jgi:vanillate O-demethylase ferredoxin subunit
MTAQAMLRVRVTARVREAQDIASFELAALGGEPLPPFSAGSHVDVEVRPGLVRQYSLCNDPSERHRYLIAVLREPQSRGGSRGMHDDIRVGATLSISAPRNHFPLAPADRYLLLAGGIGITPILCMAERLAHTGAAFALHYCTRSPGRMAFRDRIARSSFADRVRFHFDGAADGFDLQGTLRAAPPDTHVYVCGPSGFIYAVTGTAQSLGWADERVHLEYFGAAPQDTSADRPFDVTIASTGDTYHVPAGVSVLQVLLDNGIDVPVSCEQGVCGTCVTRVLGGTPDHRDHYLTDDERAANDQFTPCCSRARTPSLVLDLCPRSNVM